jgi:hypothetical protein
VCSTGPGPFPDFPNGCTANDACSIGFHLPQCCGNWAAIGINRNAQTNFDKTEQLWEAGCSGCACPVSGLATAQDGQTGQKQNVHVQCKISAGAVSGTCVTYFP